MASFKFYLIIYLEWFFLMFILEINLYDRRDWVCSAIVKTLEIINKYMLSY